MVAGGLATNGAPTLGSVSSGVGTAVVTGGTWTTLGNLDVTNGALTMSGGLVTVGGRLQSTATGVISGSGAVTKQGEGTLSLAAINFYTGVTTISAGTLALTGNASIGSGGLNLGITASRGTFDIGGILSGSYALPSTGDLVGAGTFDLVDGDGSVIYGGVVNLSFTGGFYATGTDVVQIFANTGGRSRSFTAVNSTGLGAGQSATFDPSTGRITIVPEPSVAHLVATAGLVTLAWARRRRRRTLTI